MGQPDRATIISAIGLAQVSLEYGYARSFEVAAGHRDVSPTDVDRIGNTQGTGNIDNGNGASCGEIQGEAAGVHDATAVYGQSALAIHRDASGLGKTVH